MRRTTRRVWSRGIWTIGPLNSSNKSTWSLTNEFIYWKHETESGMAECNHCGATIEHAFPCNRCSQSFCGDHRLPENHDCSQFERENRTQNFGGSGPTISDRRSTSRRRIERVREKETTTLDRRISDREKGESNKSDSSNHNRSVLSCPCCGSKTDEILSCEFCGDSICSNCDHNCGTPDASQSTEESNFISQIKRFLSR